MSSFTYRAAGHIEQEPHATSPMQSVSETRPTSLEATPPTSPPTTTPDPLAQGTMMYYQPDPDPTLNFNPLPAIFPICPDSPTLPSQDNVPTSLALSAWYPTLPTAQHRPLYYQGLGSYAEWLGLVDSAEIVGLEKLEWEVFGLGVESGQVGEEGDKLNGMKSEDIEEADEEELDRGGREEREEGDDGKVEDDIEEEDDIKQEAIKTEQDTNTTTLEKTASTQETKPRVKRERDEYEEEKGNVKRIRFLRGHV